MNNLMRKRGSLEKGLVSSLPSGYWSEQSQQHFAYPTKPPTKDGCFSRIPYSSLIAFVMCIIGVILFSLMVVWSFNATVEQTRRVLNISDIPWLDKVHIAFFITAFLMIVVAFALLSIGVLSTGSTREEVYKRSSARQGGRLSCILAISLSCFLHLLWIVLAALTAIFSFMYYVFSLLCASLPANSDLNCLDFSVFKPLVEDVSDSSLVLCSGNAQQFCALTNTVVVWYAVGFLSSVVVCLGLVQFVASAAANYAHIGNEARNAEINEILLAETRPMQSFGNGNNARKYANGRAAMDFQVDAFPAYPGNGSAGSATKYSTTPTLLAQPYQHQQLQSQFQSSSVIHPYHNNPAASYGYSQDPLPNHHYQGYYHGGSRSRRTSGNAALTAAASVGNVTGDVPTFTATRQNSVGGAVNAARRNSYHNSMKDGEYNSEPLHIY